MVRAKVYGKRARGPPNASFEVFTHNSPHLSSRPEANASNLEAVALKEKTVNKLEVKPSFERWKAGLGRVGRQCEGDCVKSAEAEVNERKEKVGNGVKNQTPQSHSQQARFNLKPARDPQDKGPDENLLDKSEESTDGLSQLLRKNLVIAEEEPSQEQEVQYVTSSQKSQTPAFRPCPAALDTDSASYLSPLLACRCVSPMVENFQAWTSERMSIIPLRKTGEGSFGEVYRATGDDQTVIMKIIPLNPRKGRGSRTYTSIEAAANEIRLLDKMQRIPGFVEFRGACVLQGHMPLELVAEWNSYKAQGRTVESRDPNKKNAYPPNQLWLLIEMSDAGTNLEPGYYQPPGGNRHGRRERYLSVQRTWDIFWQVVRALAKAEVYAEFEHRDLHLGNICAKDASLIPDEEDLTIVPRDEPTHFSLNYTTIQITLIDYSLSRAVAGQDQVLFYNLKRNDSILKGEGDLQYDIYRYMAEELRDETCRSFVPKTNVLWLAYLVEKLLEVTLDFTRDVKAKRDGYVTMAQKMRETLEEVKDQIILKHRSRWEVCSAGDVLALGTSRGWFKPEDIINE